MKISIITVVYNNESTIKSAIESVFSQTYKNIEYIIIDGNSIDNTVTIIKQFEYKLAYFISEKDGGIYDAMNKGISAASGDVIGILNSDDLYYSDTVIEAIMNEFLCNPSLDIVYGNLEYVKSDDTSKVVRKWTSKKYFNNFFENGNVPPHPSLFVKNQVYKKAGPFDLNFKLAADYEFMLRIFKNHDFRSQYIDKVIVRMRLGGATNKSLFNIIKQNKEILQAWEKNNLKTPIQLMLLRFMKRLAQFI